MPLLKMQGFVNEINFDIKKADGSCFPSLTNAVTIKDKDENIRAINVTIFNITDRKKYESQLLHAKKEADTEKKRFELLADMTPDIIFVVNPSGKVEYGNKRFYDYFNISSKELDQRWIYGKIHPGDKIRCFRNWINTIKQSKAFETEIRMQNSFGFYTWHLVRAVPYTDELTGVLKFFGSCTDIHEQKELQNKKDEFISVASHELKTPLSSLKGFIQIIQKEKVDTSISNIVNRCVKAVNNMQYLISSLLDVSQIHSGKLSLTIIPSSLHELIIESIEIININYPSHHINLHFLVDTNVAVCMDTLRMQQVLINLLSNAIKYSPRATQVDLTVEKHALQPKLIKISIQDYGIGIPKEELPFIFDKYYRVKSSTNNNKVSGLGIGLYIIQEIIQLHKSNIFIESEINKGSLFYFYLPLP
jgi:PAS domain S-box-containing protein